MESKDQSASASASSDAASALTLENEGEKWDTNALVWSKLSVFLSLSDLKALRLACNNFNHQILYETKFNSRATLNLLNNPSLEILETTYHLVISDFPVLDEMNELNPRMQKFKITKNPKSDQYYDSYESDDDFDDENYGLYDSDDSYDDDYGGEPSLCHLL